MDGGERAVIFDRLQGVLDRSTPEGTHFLVPILQLPVVYDIRTRPRSISSVTGTKGSRSIRLPCASPVFSLTLEPSISQSRPAAGQPHSPSALPPGQRQAPYHLQGTHLSRSKPRRFLVPRALTPLPGLLQRLGVDYDERVLPSIGNEVLKATVAQFNADQLLTMRETVSQQVRTFPCTC